MKPEMPEIIALQFQRLRTRIRSVAAAGGVGLTLFSVATAVGLAILMDILFDLPVAVRLGMLVAAAGLSVIGVAFWIIRPLTQRVQDDELAAIVEQQYPELNERLLSAVELDEHTDSDASPMMKKWLMQETVSLSKRVDFTDSIDASRSVRRCWWGGIACLALVLPTLFAGDAYAVLVSRFLNPWGNYERVQNLILQVVDGDRTVPQGSDVIIEVKTGWRFQPGTLPKSAWLEWTTDDSPTEARRLDWNQKTESYIGTLPRIGRSFSYHVSAARSKTRSYRINVVPLPAVEELQVEISPPAYTGHPAQFHDLVLGEIRVIEQSQWDVAVRFNKPIEKAEILWLDGTASPEQLEKLETLPGGLPIFKRTEFTLSADKQLASIEEVLSLNSPSGRFVIRGIDKEGLASDTSAIRRLTIDADQPPLIQFTDHEENTAVRPDDVLDIPVSVIDDFGMSSVELHYEMIRTEAFHEKGILKMENLRDQGRALTHSFRLDLSPLKLEPGMRLTLRGRATDERPVPKPNESWTITRSLLIRSDAKPYGEQTVVEQQQRTDQVIETLKTELQQQKEKARQFEQDAKEANANREEWEAQDDVQQMQEKLEKLQQQLEKLSALFEQQPLFDQIAKETQEIAEGKLEDASESVKQAQQAELKQKSQEFAKASEQLNDAAKQLEELQQKYREIADLQRDLLELGRLANQTERLANSVEDLEHRQKELNSQPAEPQPITNQQAKQKAWDADHREAWGDHQQLSNTLNDLFERRPELADAAAEALEKQLEQLAKRTEELSQRQENLAKAAKQSAERTVKELEAVQKQQNDVASKADELQKGLEQPEAMQDAEQAAKLLQKAQADLAEGNTADAAEAQSQAQNQFEKLAEQLRSQKETETPNESKADTKKQAQQAQEIAEQLSKSVEQLEKLIAGIEPPPQETPPQETAAQDQTTEDQPNAKIENETTVKTAPAVKPESAAKENVNYPDLLEKQKQLADIAKQIQQAVESQEGTSKEAQQASEQFATQSQQSSDQAQQLDSSQAAQKAQQAVESAQKLSEQLQQQEAPKALQQAAQQAAQQQSEVAEKLQNVAKSQSAQKEMQSQMQQQNQQEVAQLADELKKRTEELASNPINREKQAQSGTEAQQLAQQAQEAMKQSNEQAKQSNQGQASKQAQQAADSLNQASQKVMEASGQQKPTPQQPSESGQPGEEAQPGQQGETQNNSSEKTSSEQSQLSDSIVPAEVGTQVAQASRELKQAGEMLQQLGKPTPGTKGDQDGDPEEGEASQDQPMDGGEGEGQQKEGDPSQSGQQPSSSEALRQAAQSMRQAAGKSGMSQSQQKTGDSDQQAQESSSGSGNEASDFGSTQQLAELMQMQIDLSNMSKRDWGQLPGELQTELLESSQKKASGEYQKLIRRYFNDISKARSPEMKPQQN
ncbi:coiled-coil domain-containing protein [Thalassoglobus polymorphus]|uniref:Uncharacterized protein n=1 Tax=Thalassoglobus polymorphus TaxID=2527994 RepID=A0A517QP98_9PLAN|nr:hypothetical protein [Thalassoglobus polymorphus]QDT33443.1 hypothetical protein Mal48_26960 [Thalassoglobus polymorphus]